MIELLNGLNDYQKRCKTRQSNPNCSPNVEIGENTVIPAQTGVAGSTKIGKKVHDYGQVGFAGHLTIGNNVRIQAQSGVGRNVKMEKCYKEAPTFGYTDFSKSYVHFKKFYKIVSEFEDLKTINNKD